MAQHRKLLVIQVAGLGYEFLSRRGATALEGIRFRPTRSVFPAVTCTVSASFRTAALPASHGMVANGLFLHDLGRPMFWEQSAALVAGERIWSGFRARGGRVAMLFWQQSLGEEVDIVLSPAPIHKHHGGMIQDCYSRPEGLYRRLCLAAGRDFDLAHYWGPLASPKVGDWIAAAAATVLEDPQLAPDLCLLYLPTLDYDLQRFPAEHKRNTAALGRLLGQLRLLTAAARRTGHEVLLFGDYAIAPVRQAVFPNRALRDEGLMAVRSIRDMLYPDFHESRGFAVVDHEIAHVHVRKAKDVPAAAAALAALPGVAEVLGRKEQAKRGVDHPRSGELLLVAGEGAWFAYPWWSRKREAPEFAAHVDIHNKPGYDPCELFFGWPPMTVGTNSGKVRGSHGRVGAGREVAWASTLPLANEPSSLISLAEAARDWLNGSP